MSHTVSGHIVLSDRVLAGKVAFEGDIISIEAQSSVPERYIVPGFIDVHVHGGNGADTMDGVAGIKTMTRFHMEHGTTTILPTTITRPWAEITEILRAIAEIRRKGVEDGPSVLGAHLEGPFISPGRLGAQPGYAINPALDKVHEVIALDAVRVVTMAPELEGAAAAMEAFARAGVRVSLGHTTCSYAQAHDAIDCVCHAGGTAGGTHLFNAMGGIEARAPGLAGALLSDERAYAEMIFDTHHVHPANFNFVRHLLPERLLFVTDAMRGAGQKEGESELGGQKVIIHDGVARGMQGQLAGSVLTLDVAMRNALAHGATLPEISALLSHNAARYLGLHDRGEIAPGKRADLLVLDESMTIEQVWVGGERRL